MRKHLDDILFIFGGLLLVAGCYYIFPVAALFAGGILLIILGFMAGIGKSPPDERKTR
jgi:uncharacterized membrane-anchored protein